MKDERVLGVETKDLLDADFVVIEVCDLRLVTERPGLGMAMTVFSLSALGIPGFSSFWGKYYVFKAALAAGLAPVAVAALVGSVVAAFYYLRLVKVMWFDASPGPTDSPPREAASTAYATAFFAFPAVMIVLIALDPLAHVAATALAQR